MVDVAKREDRLLDTISELIRKRDNAIAYAHTIDWSDYDQNDINQLVAMLR